MQGDVVPVIARPFVDAIKLERRLGRRRIVVHLLFFQDKPAVRDMVGHLERLRLPKCLYLKRVRIEIRLQDRMPGRLRPRDHHVVMRILREAYGERVRDIDDDVALIQSTEDRAASFRPMPGDDKDADPSAGGGPPPPRGCFLEWTWRGDTPTSVFVSL